MAKVNVVMPQMGESITEGTIVKWHKKVGDKIMKDETLLEISTDKVDSEIPSPFSGILTKILVEEQKTVPVQTNIAEIETDVTVAAGAIEQGPRQAEEKRQPEVAQTTSQLSVAPIVERVHEEKGARFFSPLVLSIAQQEGIGLAELENIPGSGLNGRVSKNDVLAYVKNRQTAPVRTQPAGSTLEVGPGSKGKPVDDATLRAKYPAPQNEILQMNNVVQKMAQHMVHSWNTAPHVGAISEADMTAIVQYREKHTEEFEKREGFKLTYTHFIMEAVIKALKDFPLVNSAIEGDKIIVKKYINLGMAVASDNGLIVPVIKNADEKNFVGMARAINDLAQRTRAKKLSPDDITNGTFTVTNYGVFGNIIGTPIINPPQVAILGIGAFQKRPVVINDAIAIRTMSYLTLSFDHRIIDGALGGMFVQRVVKYLEEFDTKQTL
jgi:2-oxoglutarate dehydrogenase E2 component (dihydrolipoamide succinyltransferase)